MSFVLHSLKKHCLILLFLGFNDHCLFSILHFKKFAMVGLGSCFLLRYALYRKNMNYLCEKTCMDAYLNGLKDALSKDPKYELIIESEITQYMRQYCYRSSSTKHEFEMLVIISDKECKTPKKTEKTIRYFDFSPTEPDLPPELHDPMAAIFTKLDLANREVIVFSSSDETMLCECLHRLQNGIRNPYYFCRH